MGCQNSRPNSASPAQTEAKRKLAEGAVKLEGETVTDPAQLVLPEEGQTFRLSLGKKRHALVYR